jgi:predicted O-methyltransferase YrrM
VTSPRATVWLAASGGIAVAAVVLGVVGLLAPLLASGVALGAAVAGTAALVVGELRRLRSEIADLASRQRRSRAVDVGHLAQTAALLNLHALVPVRAAVPIPTTWAASPDVLLLLVDHILTARPHLVTECGSGASTIWMGYAAQQVGGCRVVALEHDGAFARQTEKAVRAHGLSDVVEVREAAVVPVDVNGQSWSWYEPAAWEDLDGIELLFVDGPPGTLGEQARYPALPLLAGRMASDAMVVLDDAGRKDEKLTAARWASGSDATGRWSLEPRPLLRGAAVLRRPAAGGAD